ncbi:HEAT repeat domain-containing protein [Lentzea kentuckyensis]|uniref:HEAT repeat domain-containing protein n=1 Tax=Lentzea kentuckyensis TaxID=360086 RepID=UPI000A36E4C5|nr:HEAT repeat domain-containing protein [Lentzea kentuckyensis]
MQRIRVFLSSPGDVADERAIALEVLDRLPYEPALRGRVALEVVAWDKPGAGAPILASGTPQASIDSGLPRPRDCDVVVVLFWARMGTPLPYPEYSRAGQPYLSGTEWEFEDGVSGSGQVLLYRRTTELLISASDPERTKKQEQYDRVEGFFARLRDPVTGAILRGHKGYAAPEQFREELSADLREVLHRLVVGEARQDTGPRWRGSPFPGLRSFTPNDAPIYFGRGRETDELVSRVDASRFVAVVGASGSGKSSLVGAGLIPRLAARGWTVPEHTGNQWFGPRFTPAELGDDPFLALAVKLGGTPREVVRDLRAGDLARHVTGETLIFVDQFEELFTIVAPEHVEPFVALLANPGPAHVVATVRSDFYHRCVEIPALAKLLETGQFPLSTPTDTLIDMIARPAERAGLEFDEGLPGRILDDAGKQPGTLPLLAYTLDELHRVCPGTLTHHAYERLGGVAGAIGTRAEDVFQRKLDDATRATFDAVFRELVDIDEHGHVARRRAPLSTVVTNPAAERLIDVFVEARLLVRSADAGQEPVVSAAHEALFGSWDRLREWIELGQDDLVLLRRVRAAAREWDEADRADAYLWQHERLQPVYEMIARLQPTVDPVLEQFIRPEHERLLAEFTSPALEGYRRQNIADRLCVIGVYVVPELMDAMLDGVPAVRTAAAAALARLAPASVIGLVEAAAHHPSADVRLAALSALRQTTDPQVVPALGHALHDPDDRVRSLASGGLRAIGGAEAQAILAAASTDADVDIRWQAVGMLGAFGEAAVSPLLLAMRDNDVRVRTDALRALQAICADAPEPLISALHDQSASVRAAATEVLGTLDERAIPALLAARDDLDDDVAWRVADALEALGHNDPVDELIANLPDGIEALVRCGDEAVTPLQAALMSPRPSEVRVAAARALSRLGPDGAEALQAAVEDERPQVWLRAMDALETWPGGMNDMLNRQARQCEVAIALLPTSDLLLAAALMDAPTRQMIAQTLQIRSTEEVKATVVRLMQDRERSVWAAATDSAAVIGSEMLPLLAPLVHSANSDVRTAVELALRAIGGEAVPWLLDLVSASDQRARKLAIAVLTDIGTPAAVFGLAERGIQPRK